MKTRIEIIRKELGLSRAYVSKKTKISVPRLIQIERSNTELLGSEFTAIAGTLSCKAKTIVVKNLNDGGFYPRLRKFGPRK